jgi:putative membrane protein
MHPFYGPSSQLIGGGNYWWLGMASMVLYLLFWAIVIVFAAKLFKKYYPGMDHQNAKEDTALSILRERYARGEIDTEEFKQKKADLE